MSIDKLKFPIGHFDKPKKITKEVLQSYISQISNFPQRLRNEVEHLKDLQLDTQYREGGWTIRQVVNHCADSHMNSFIRFKLALTEDKPAIKPYFEDRWTELSDTKSFPIESSLKILDGLHQRWAFLLINLNNEKLARTFVHPDYGTEFRIDETIGLYAWHCNHHLAYITELKLRKGWR